MHFVLQQGRCGSMICTIVILFFEVQKKNTYLSVGNPKFMHVTALWKNSVFYGMQRIPNAEELNLKSQVNTT